jgi:hypothetical protein
MRSSLSLAATIILAGCGTSEGFFSDPPQAGTGGEGASGKGGSSGGSGKAGSGSGKSPGSGSPTQLAQGPVSMVGVTSDDWVVFRDADALRAVKIGVRPEVEEITLRPGSVLIRGKVVFNWADVDWTSNLGDLSVWTAEAGTHEIGETPYAEGLIAASEQGGAIVYTANTNEQTTDLILSGSDLSSPQVIIESMGLGSEETCGASIGFVGERLFVGWCEAGSRAGRLERFERVDDEWRSTPLADDSLPAWSADAIGERVFYQSSVYSAYYAENGKNLLIDAGVGRGLVLPDGSAAFYTVGDQLRRTTLPEVNPIPIVTRGYAQPIEFSPGFDLALYSTIVTYDDGTRRDLRLVPTDAFDAAPIELVTEPVAVLPRSSMTRDGRFVLYLTNVTPVGASLHVVEIDGTERLVLPNVVEVLAAYDSTIVFTDNSSDPDQYPLVTDLKVIDVTTNAAPLLLEAKIVEGRRFELDSTRERVVYVRSGVDRDPSVSERDGLFFQGLR